MQRQRASQGTRRCSSAISSPIRFFIVAQLGADTKRLECKRIDDLLAADPEEAAARRFATLALPSLLLKGDELVVVRQLL